MTITVLLNFSLNPFIAATLELMTSPESTTVITPASDSNETSSHTNSSVTGFETSYIRLLLF